jgi:uncharacterized protein YidB (DUF937 family)
MNFVERPKERTMGLLDAILGNIGGTGSASSSRSSGMSISSPIVKGIMMLLAAKAAQSYGGRSGSQSSGGLGDLLGGGGGGGLGSGTGGGLGSGTGGGLGGLLGGGLGGLLGGLSSGAASSGGGLGGLLDQFRSKGYGDHVDSWVGTGQNRALSPDHLADVLGPDALDELQQNTGMPREQLLEQLATEMPEAVDHLSPEGKLPDDQDLFGRIA